MTFNHHYGRAGVGPALPFRIKRGDIVARNINVEINGQFVQKDSKNAGVMGEGNVATLHITCDDSWRGYGKRIVWRDVNGENPVSVILFETDSAPADPLIYDTTIPAEPMALPGWCSFTIEGYNEVDGVHKVAMSVSDHLYVEQSDSYYKPAEPTPSQTQQILEALGKTEESVKKIATEAKSWAVGGTGTREGEDTDNSKYYSSESKKSAEDAKDSEEAAKESAEDAAESVKKYPYVDKDKKTWFVWDSASGSFVDTGVKAEGESGIEANGLWGTHIDENGDLIITYTGDSPPPLKINENGELVYSLVDGQEINLGKVIGSGGGEYTIGSGLKLDEETNTLSVDTADQVEADNDKPITAAAVFTAVGNIQSLLESI